MDISAKLTLDTGPFADALAKAVKAVESLAGESGELARQLGEAKARLDALADEAAKAETAQKEAAEAARKLAEEQKNAAAESGKLADKEKDAGKNAKELADGAAAAKGGMAAFSAASAAAEGNAAGAASAMMQLHGALKALGTASKALPWLALAAAIAAVAVHFAKMRSEARQARIDEALQNAQYAADRLARSISRVNEALGRQTALSRELRSVADESADVEGRIALAKLERERQEALRAAPADQRDAIDAHYDRLRNGIVRDNAVAASGRAVAEMGARRGENEESIARLREQMAAVRRQAAEARGRGAEIRSEIGAAGNNPFVDVGALSESARREDEHAVGLDRQYEALDRQLNALVDENQVLGAKIEAAAKDVELADAERAAADATLDTSLAIAAESAGGQNGADASAPGRDRGGPLSVSTDRLARIGGYVGGATPMKKSEDLLQKANDQRERLIAATESLANARAKFA